MTTFSIDTNNDILAFTSADHVPEGHDHFATEKDLAKLTAEWPITRLVDVWNNFAGVVPFDTLKPVKKFTDRKTATTRIWTAIQKLDEDLLRGRIREAEAELDAEAKLNAEAKLMVARIADNARAARQAADGAPKKTKATKNTTAPDNVHTPRPGSKTAIVLDLLKRADGATLAEIMTATGWQSHSVRGFISGAITKKMGLNVASAKRADGARFYQIS